MKSKILSATIALPLAFAFVSCEKPEAIETAAEEAPAEEAPAKEAPAKEAPAEEAPAEPTPK